MNEENKDKALDAVKNSEPGDVRPVVYALLYIGDMIRRNADLSKMRGE